MGVQKIEFQFFWGYEDFRSHHKTGLVLGVISMHFQYTEYGYLGGGAKISDIFGGMPGHSNIFGIRSKPTYEEKVRVPPTPPFPEIKPFFKVWNISFWKCFPVTASLNGPPQIYCFK